MLAKAVELAETHGWFLCRQFENEANANIHSQTTAQEILADFPAGALDYWVTGFGTGGTLKGVARVLKEKSPTTKIVVCEPDNSQMLGSGIAQPRDAGGKATESHPLFRPHLMQGWSPDFIPKLAEDVVDANLIDDVVPIAGADALRLSRELAQKEGIFVGISSGATFAGALEVCRRAGEGATVLCMLPDTAERYLTTPLFEDIEADMNAEEIEISRSTPSFRFDAPPANANAAKPTDEEKIVDLDIDAQAFVSNVIGDTEQPVAMFALEWCEFCWSVRKLFARLGIPYQSVDLDSVTYQEGDRGGKIRAVLKDLTSEPTIPQIFVGGKHIGGCTEVFDAYNDGELQKLLEANGVEFDTEASFDAYELMPGWLHSR
jgi:cysteine synthase A